MAQPPISWIWTKELEEPYRAPESNLLLLPLLLLPIGSILNKRLTLLISWVTVMAVAEAVAEAEDLEVIQVPTKPKMPNKKLLSVI